MRSIGNVYAKNNKHAEAIEAFGKSLALSPLYPMTWFMMGCSALQLEDWEKALIAFTRVVQQEPDVSSYFSKI
jgi:tetratricopeptide (TPR) repeat protein